MQKAAQPWNISVAPIRSWTALTYRHLDLSAQENYAIKMATEYGKENVVKLLLRDSRVDPAADSNYVIKYAATHGHLAIVALLVQHPGVDPAADDNYALEWATRCRNIEICRLLLDDGRVLRAYQLNPRFTLPPKLFASQ